jgi:pSer/pThr/pTyr-binding forkhead associated (FHA) protein
MIATVVLVLRIALTIALYFFLVWALSTVLQDLRQQGSRIATQKKPGITLFVKLAQGVESQRFFAQTEIRIGRDTNCDLSMMDETMSAHHARLIYHHGQWWLEDLNSTNGTFLNHERLNTSTVIITGDEFKCGNTVFGIRVEVDDKLSPTITF